jgi:hypothetical protein
MAKPTEFERRIQVAEFDKRIAEMRLEHMEREKAKAEFQANWYENAPLSWLLRKTAHAFDRAVTTRMTKVAKEVPVYDGNILVSVSEKINTHDLKVLGRSYEQSVGLQLVGPTGTKASVIRYAWLVYRAIRKAAKLIFKPLFSRRGA